jgi:hypothetical protein
LRRSACIPKGSWFIAIIYSFPKIYKVELLIFVKSHPISRGDFKAAQRAKWDWYWSWDIPPFPTSSISGSFQAPGPAYWESPAWLYKLCKKDSQKSLISKVVLQEFAIFFAQRYGFYLPHSHIEKYIGLPV